MLRTVLTFFLVWHLTFCEFYAQEQVGTTGITVVVESKYPLKNKIGGRPAKAPIVRVVDNNKKPVADAQVWFFFPDPKKEPGVQGPNVQVSNGANLSKVFTNRDGLATPQGLVTNNLKGKFNIRIEAFHEVQRADTRIVPQENVNPWPLWIKVSIGLAAAGGTAYVICKKAGWEWCNGISISPGPPTVGPPR
jgi:hypothetical protein